MRIYSDTLQMIKEEERNLIEMGTEVKGYSMQDKIIEGDEDYYTKEIRGTCFILKTGERIKEMIDYINKEYNAGLSMEWIEAEAKERVSQHFVNPGMAWTLRKDVWQEFLHQDEKGQNKFSYTYNERIKPQLSKVIQELHDRPNTRQAIIEIHNNVFDLENMGGKKRIPCFPVKTKIITRDFKWTNIENIKEGDKVLTHKGRFKRVNKIFENETNELIKIKRYGGEDIICTKDHPILTYSSKEKITSKNIREVKSKWLSASEIKEGDYIEFNFNNSRKDIKYLNITDYINTEDFIEISSKTIKAADKKNCHSIPKIIQVDEDFLRLVGYFLADGCATGGRDGKSQIKFYFAKGEEKYGEDVAKIMLEKFGLKKPKFNWKEDGNNYRITYASKIVGHLFWNLFGGSHSHTKTIPKSFMYLPPKKQLQIVVGYTRGDGYVTKNKKSTGKTGRLTFTSCSKDLILQLGLILLRNNVSYSIQFIPIRSGHAIEGRHFYHSSYSISTSNRSLKELCYPGLPHIKGNWKNNNINTVSFNKGKAYYKVKGIEVKKYIQSIKVYNLEVEEDESYSLLGASVHNCSTGYMFLRRENKLHMSYIMRSCDFVTHFPNDIALAIKLQQYITKQIGVTVGDLTYFCNSLHIYKKDYKNKEIY